MAVAAKFQALFSGEYCLESWIKVPVSAPWQCSPEDWKNLHETSDSCSQISGPIFRRVLFCDLDKKYQFHLPGNANLKIGRVFMKQVTVAPEFQVLFSGEYIVLRAG
ncbi:hypothetical protein AVEN_197561-1 [Araneus ventricosus]|uniref:Uncharacterized protein n=1 Tax=Araneus ventricosus TaxID=182803 RepID=A0A4Y2BTW3_ARAVE|nr:hypothetical protein AVEN_197561-1 [Araneus ventricosus]